MQLEVEPWMACRRTGATRKLFLADLDPCAGVVGGGEHGCVALSALGDPNRCGPDSGDLFAAEVAEYR